MGRPETKRLVTRLKGGGGREGWTTFGAEVGGKPFLELELPE